MATVREKKKWQETWWSQWLWGRAMCKQCWTSVVKLGWLHDSRHCEVIYWETHHLKKVCHQDINHLYISATAKKLKTKAVIFTVREKVYILLGVIAEVFPEYMTPYAERLNGLYLGAIKAEVTTVWQYMGSLAVNFRNICRPDTNPSLSAVTLVTLTSSMCFVKYVIYTVKY